MYDEDTTIGGDRRYFQLTNWSEIQSAKNLSPLKRKSVINSIIQKYWKPVYFYIRHKGYDNETAKDMTQDFFQEIVLGKHLIERADKTKGRFRTLILAALDRYLTSAHRKRTARKRAPVNGIFKIQASETADFIPADCQENPEDVFNYAWAANLIDEVIERVKDECFNTEKKAHWKVFQSRVLQPIFESTKPPPMKQLCKEYNISSPNKASNMLVTVKRKFQVALKHSLSKYSFANGEIEQEQKDLYKILSKGNAR